MGVGNSDWLALYPHSSVNHLTPIASDHRPILISTCIDQGIHSPFRFEAMWLEDNSIYDIVNNSWKTSVTGSPPHRLASKIKIVKQDLKVWNRNVFGNCFSKAKDIKQKIEVIQHLEKTDSNSLIEKDLLLELDGWLNKADIFWRQRAKERWIKDGDANTRYFHLTTIIHSRYNKINSISSSNNQICYDRPSIGVCFVNFYSRLFKTDFNQNLYPFPDNLENLFVNCFSDQDILTLNAIPSLNEIKSVLFSFADHKSPGPALQEI
ncbi:hypothetical protein CASFOL_034256 [Castilleja foliolosa]|uniref:Endonuclease/exonuclease/phosphatase domain-containing protein n=1 Tax=Castilleja foliolosa TaxID=1961234 RepID=A0ABD3BZH1_9LAMI